MVYSQARAHTSNNLHVDVICNFKTKFQVCFNSILQQFQLLKSKYWAALVPSLQWDSSIFRFPLNVLRTLLTVFLQPRNSPLFWATQICCWIKWSQTSQTAFHGHSFRVPMLVLSSLCPFQEEQWCVHQTVYCSFPSTVNPALIRRTFAEDVLFTMSGPPHYHIMQNSALLSSSDLIVSLAATNMFGAAKSHHFTFWEVEVGDISVQNGFHN